MKTIDFNQFVYTTYLKFIKMSMNDEEFSNDANEAKKSFCEHLGMNSDLPMAECYKHFWSGMYLACVIFDNTGIKDKNGEVILLE